MATPALRSGCWAPTTSSRSRSPDGRVAMPLKDTVLHAMHRSGAFAPFRLANRSKTLILVYHRFSATDAPGATSARAFAEQLAYLRARYTIVPLSTVLAQL